MSYSYQTNDAYAEDALKHYTVTEDGRVFSGDKERRQHINHAGYATVQLKAGGKYKKFRVHRLVAMKYLVHKPDMAINHIDGDKLNNHYTNLEYTTVGENLRHYWQSGKWHQRIKLDHSRAEKIREQLAHGEKATNLAKEYGVTAGYIRQVAKGQYWGRLTTK